MRRLAANLQTTEVSPATVGTDCVTPITEAGRRLSEARSEDKVWRENVSRRLYRRLAIAEKCDSLLQRWGAGLGATLMTVAIGMTYSLPWVHDDGTYGRVLVALIFSTTGFTAAALVLLKGIAWYWNRTRTWLERHGLGNSPRRIRNSTSIPICVEDDWAGRGKLSALAWFMIVLFAAPIVLSLLVSTASR